MYLPFFCAHAMHWRRLIIDEAHELDTRWTVQKRFHPTPRLHLALATAQRSLILTTGTLRNPWTTGTQSDGLNDLNGAKRLNGLNEFNPTR
jgi:hypothetical protein